MNQKGQVAGIMSAVLALLVVGIIVSVGIPIITATWSLNDSTPGLEVIVGLIGYWPLLVALGLLFVYLWNRQGVPPQ